MHPTRTLTLCSLALVVLAALSGQAFASTYYVANTTQGATGCAPGTYFTTISAAISDIAVPAGSTIKVCPGTYPEQVLVNKRITLEGFANPTEGQDAAVIVPPAGGAVANAADVCPALYSAYCTNGAPIAAQILVTVSSVSISNLTVDGFGNQLPICSATDLMGILFQNASGTVNHVAVRNQVTGDTVNGCQTGKGIYVESSTGTSVVTVENSSVHNYSKNGITARYPGTNVTVTGNYVQGSGVQNPPGAAQNGIEIAFGATGTVKTNTVIDNVWYCPVANAGGNGCNNVSSASDILLYDAAENSGIAVQSNTLGNAQIPIGLETFDEYGPSEYGDGVNVSSNKIFGTGYYDAIDVCTNGNTVTGNTIFNSAESGVHLDSSCSNGNPTGNNNTVNGNTFVESACAGILQDTATTGNTTGTETNWTVAFPVLVSSTAFPPASCPNIPAFGGAAAQGKPEAKVRPAP